MFLFVLRNFNELAAQYDIHTVNLVQNEKGRGLTTKKPFLRRQIVFEIPHHLILEQDREDPAADLLLATNLLQTVFEEENGFWNK